MRKRCPRQETAPAKQVQQTTTKSEFSRAGIDQPIDNAASSWWCTGAMLAIKQLARSGRGFDADHVLSLVGQPEDFHYVGSVFAAAQRSKIIEAVGCRVASDGRLLRVWWGVPS